MEKLSILGRMLEEENYSLVFDSELSMKVYEENSYVTRVELLSDGRFAVESTNGLMCLYAKNEKDALNIVFFIYHCTHN